MPTSIERAHYVLFVAPKCLSPDPHNKEVEGLARPYRELLLSWFAWVSYGREERRRFCRECETNHPDEAVSQRVLETTIPFPVPFREVVDLVTANWVKRDDSRNLAWLGRVMHAVCINHGEMACRLGSADPPCGDDPQRAQFVELAGLIPWRFTPAPGTPVEWESALAQLERLTFDSEARPANTAMELGRESQLKWFAGNFWQDWLGHRSEYGLRRDEIETALRSCTLLTHHLKGALPLDEGTIQALIWAMSRYASDVLKVEPRLDIAAHLLQAARGEPGLHSLREFYRDHFFHAFQTCLLGHQLLAGAVAADGTSLLDLCAGRLGSPEDVLREWYVASLLHDVGYTIDLIGGATKSLRFYARSDSLIGLADGIDSLVSDLNKRIEQCGFQRFTFHDEPGRDHGAVAALHLRDLVNSIRRSKPDVDSYDAAIAAIAWHNGRRKVVSFRDDPLGFLLILCDTVQEWNRPKLAYAMAPMAILARLINGSEAGDQDERALTSTLDLLPPPGPGSNSLVAIDLRYGTDICHDNAVFHMWLDASANLQRLDFTGFPFDLRLTFTTPTLRDHRGRESQMDRLKEAAIETHMNFLADWFPRPSNRAVHHSINEKLGTETLALDVRELATARPITAEMSSFHRLLGRWSRFDEDRVFAGDYAPEPPG